ncbi:hypothetical protein ABEZ86_00070 [Micromonospora provocatoris]
MRCNTRDQQFYLRTNTNRLLPLNDLEQRYTIITILENKNELVKEFKKVEDFLKIEKIDEGKYALFISNIR